MNDIFFSRESHIGLITLQRVQALNALTLPMIIALQQQLTEWQQDDDIHAVVIQAAPGKAFCAGGDVRWIYDKGATDPQEQLQFFWHEYRLNYFIHQFSKPYIALMDGITMGGGVGISLHGSHPVASERFVFAMPETGIGFFPDIGASYLLTQCPHSAGVYLGLTGNRIGAADAEELGLVQAIVAADHFQNIIDCLVESDLSTGAHARVDVCLQYFAILPQLAPILDLAPAIHRAFHHADVESVMSALADGKDGWSHETLAILQQKAPLSLKVTLAQLQKARSINMADCIKMDYCLVGHFMSDPDFYEGVRALLIDKDKMPHWKPKALSSINATMVEDYFKSDKPSLLLL